jgi:hypothetical protein
MKSKLITILDSYEDFELAFLSQYKHSSYMKGTRDSISQYILSRGLTPEKIELLIQETKNTDFPNDVPRCPRCKSSKLRTDNVEYYNTALGTSANDAAAIDGLTGKATYKDQIICEICDLYINDPNKERGSKNSTICKIIKSIFLN